MNDERLLETTVKRRDLYTGRYLTFHVDTVEDSTGGRHDRELVDHPGAVAILALDGDELLMVRQYRTPVGRVLLEIPAGTLDRDATGSAEDPLVAAQRELGEETGHSAARWRRLGAFFTAPGFANEEMHLFLATELSPIEGYAGPDPDERLELERVAWSTSVAMVQSGALSDAKSMLAILWLERILASGEVSLISAS